MRGGRSFGRGGGGRIHPSAAAGRLRMPTAPAGPAPAPAAPQGPVPGTPSDLPGGSEGPGEMGDMRSTLLGAGR